jgi:hypothetical protein
VRVADAARLQLREVNGVVVSGGVAYWFVASDGLIYSCSTSGCSGTPTLLADYMAPTNGIGGMTTDGVNVYWTNTGRGVIAKCAVGGCSDTATSIVTGQHPYKIATDGVNVYWTDQSANTVNKCSVGGCGSATTTANQSGVNDIAVDATNVYWTTGGQVMQMPK